MTATIPIILVDDEPMDRYVMARRLRESSIDCIIHEFEAGDLFLDVFTEPTRYEALIGAGAPPAVVCLDINMPRKSGFDVLEQIAQEREQGKPIPRSFFLLMITSSNNRGDKEKASGYDFVLDFMSKPLNVDQLQRLLDAHYPK